MTPTDEFSNFIRDDQFCSGGHGFSEVYYLTFKPKSGNGSPVFTGLRTREIQRFGINSCELDPSASTWSIGVEDPRGFYSPSLGPNQIDDGNTKCFDTDCVTEFKQRFQTGKCFTPEYTHIFKLQNGVGTVTRADTGGN